MKESRFAGRTVLLTSTALILVVLSLVLPWFDFSYSATVSDPGFGPVHSYDSATFYLDHYSSGSQFSPYNDFEDSNLTNLMFREELLVALWAIAGLAFIGATLINAKGESVVFGGLAVLFGTLGIIQFAVGIGPAVADSCFAHGTFSDIGFLGSGDVVHGGASYHCDYGPSLAIASLVTALALQTVAVILRSNVAIKAIREEKRKTPADDLDNAGEGPP